MDLLQEGDPWNNQIKGLAGLSGLKKQWGYVKYVKIQDITCHQHHNILESFLMLLENIYMLTLLDPFLENIPCGNT